MSEQDRNKAWGFSIFGDDIRVEVGGKMSLMGLYQADMFFPDNLPFPISIPRMCILVMYYELKDSIEGDVLFKVSFGSEANELLEFTLPRQDLAEASESIPTDTRSDGTERIAHSRIPIVLSPFVIPELGRLRVRAHFANGSTLKMGSIAVRQIPVEQFNQMIQAGPNVTPAP